LPLFLEEEAALPGLLSSPLLLVSLLLSSVLLARLARDGAPGSGDSRPMIRSDVSAWRMIAWRRASASASLSEDAGALRHTHTPIFFFFFFSQYSKILSLSITANTK
jgi:hypothetical protein